MATTTVIFGPGTTPQSGGTLSAEVRQMYARRLLLALDPDLIHNQFCEGEPIPQQTGNTMIFRRWERIAPNTTALTEGVTPSSDVPTVTPITLTVSQYGRWIPITDWASWLMIDKPQTQIIDRQGQQGAQTIDQLASTMMSAGTVVQYANGRTARASITSTDIMTAIEMKKAVRTLKMAFAKPFKDGCFVGINHPNTVLDIQAMAEWLTPHEYSAGQTEGLYKGEVGMLFGIRFVESPLAVEFAAAGSASTNVYSTVVFGQEAYVRSEISGHSMEHILQELGSGGTSDPLRQRATSGWKASWAGTRGNELKVVRIEHATSQG